MGKFINPFTDIGFKRIFGQEMSKPLLLDFLNNLLKGEKRIVNIKFLDKEQPAEYSGDRSLIYDIFCRTDNGERIIVEMQNKEQPNFADRCLYYYSQAIARQGEKGTDWRYHVDAVYLIAFINFHMDGLGDEFRTDVVLYNLQKKEVFSDKERFIFLQLPNFRKEADECDNDFERWIYVLKNMDILDRMPWAAKDSVFHKLAEIAEVSNMSKEERIRYDSALRHYRDTISVLQGAEDKGWAKGMAKGMAKGIAKGIAKGAEENNIKNARTMKRLGISKDVIMQVTGLSSEKIDSL